MFYHGGAEYTLFQTCTKPTKKKKNNMEIPFFLNVFLNTLLCVYKTAFYKPNIASAYGSTVHVLNNLRLPTSLPGERARGFLSISLLQGFGEPTMSLFFFLAWVFQGGLTLDDCMIGVDPLFSLFSKPIVSWYSLMIVRIRHCIYRKT